MIYAKLSSEKISGDRRTEQQKQVRGANVNIRKSTGRRMSTRRRGEKKYLLNGTSPTSLSYIQSDFNFYQ